MDDEPFYYLNPGDVVPRDAAYIIIGGTVKVISPHIFREYKNLARVELQEGVEEIGKWAFAGCTNLTRVVFPSSLRKIDEGAFYMCERLSEVFLMEGLRWIGEAAFFGCGLMQITVPSSVVEIEEYAFSCCDNLEAVTLAGGVVMVRMAAFFDCPRLERITISSTAVVVHEGEDGDGWVAAVNGGIQWHTREGSAGLILASPHLELMPGEELTDLKDAIEQITVISREADRLNFAGRVGEGCNYPLGRVVSGRIRDYFLDHLSTWYRSYKIEAATILELAFWKIELERTREATGQSHAAGGAKRAMTDVPTRDDCLCTCRADPVVGLVLSFLAGPHRRADQTEMQDRSSSGEERERLLVPRSSPNYHGWRMWGSSLLRTMLEMIGLRSSEIPPS